MVPWVVITTTCGAVGGGGVVGLMISCFRCWISMISAVSLWHITAIYMLCFETALLGSDKFSTESLKNYFSFLTESRGSSLWRLCQRWWHRELSVRQIAVSPLTAWYIGLMTLGFSARLTWYLHWILLWYVRHWNEYDIFLWTLVLLCLDKLSTVSS